MLILDFEEDENRIFFFYCNVIESRKNIIEKELNLMKYFFYKSKNVFKNEDFENLINIC